MAFFNLLNGICIVIATDHQTLPFFETFLTHEVTGISPQSKTVAQLSKGFAASGTLYPPLNRTFREPLASVAVSPRPEYTY